MQETEPSVPLRIRPTSGDVAKSIQTRVCTTHTTILSDLVFAQSWNHFVFFLIICLAFSGWYWIDPNLGMPDDAIYVYCNMTGTGETCVFPDVQSAKMPNIPWRKTGTKSVWYSKMRGASKVRWSIFITFHVIIDKFAE